MLSFTPERTPLWPLLPLHCSVLECGLQEGWDAQERRLTQAHGRVRDFEERIDVLQSELRTLTADVAGRVSSLLSLRAPDCSEQPVGEDGGGLDARELPLRVVLRLLQPGERLEVPPRRRRSQAA